MGWTQQGYNAQGFNPTLKIKSDYWYVENNGETIGEVEKYYEQQPDIDNWSAKIKIVYGMSGSEYFRGYILTPNIDSAKLLLRKFHGFLCYEHKYGGEKQFNSSNLILFPFLDLIFFYEKNPARIDNQSISDDTIVRDFLKELEFGIRHKFVNDFGKTLDEIGEGLAQVIELKGF